MKAQQSKQNDQNGHQTEQDKYFKNFMRKQIEKKNNCLLMYTTKKKSEVLIKFNKQRNWFKLKLLYYIN